MNIREEYQLEMKKVKPSKALNDKILEQAALEQERPEKKKKRNPVFSLGALAAAVVLVVMIGSNFNNIKSFASSFWGKLTLTTGSKHMELDIEPIQIDKDEFISQEGTELVLGSDSNYWNTYSSLEECEKKTGMKLWDSDQLSCSEVGVVLDKYDRGIIYYDCKYKGDTYKLSGMFATKPGVHPGYGIENEYYKTYAYGNGKKAYFIITNNEHNKADQVVYFTANNVLYQLGVDASETGTKRAEELIDIIAADE